MDKEKLWNDYWDEMLREEIKSGKKRIFSRKSLFDYFASDHTGTMKDMMWWAYSQTLNNTKDRQVFKHQNINKEVKNGKRT